jgi:Cytochrome c554 and c-prime
MRSRPAAVLAFLMSVAAYALCGQIASQTSASDSLSLATRDRLDDPGWWPTKGNSSRSQYVGVATCSGCHVGLAEVQKTTPMYHAGVRAIDSKILQTHSLLTYEESKYHSTLSRADGDGVTFSVTDGTGAVSQRAAWAFGMGEVGQTFLFGKDGVFTEGRLSYYTALGSLAVTTGQPLDAPSSLDGALGRTLDPVTTQNCFSCHTTAAVASNKFEPDKATPGVMCEACHGPGAQHVAAVSTGHADLAPATIFNPARLSPVDSVDFCGSCHRTWADVAMGMPANIGLISVRFQPYRLEESRCWGKNGDFRLTCMACHDPHRPLERELRSYDSKCLACHGTKGHSEGKPARACRVSADNCASCHMPKYELPQTHAMFTDHYIRVVRTGEGFRP